MNYKCFVVFGLVLLVGSPSPLLQCCCGGEERGEKVEEVEVGEDLSWFLERDERRVQAQVTDAVGPSQACDGEEEGATEEEMGEDRAPLKGLQLYWKKRLRGKRGAEGSSDVYRVRYTWIGHSLDFQDPSKARRPSSVLSAQEETLGFLEFMEDESSGFSEVVERLKVLLESRAVWNLPLGARHFGLSFMRSSVKSFEEVIDARSLSPLPGMKYQLLAAGAARVAFLRVPPEPEHEMRTSLRRGVETYPGEDLDHPPPDPKEDEEDLETNDFASFEASKTANKAPISSFLVFPGASSLIPSYFSEEEKGERREAADFLTLSFPEDEGGHQHLQEKTPHWIEKNIEKRKINAEKLGHVVVLKADFHEESKGLTLENFLHSLEKQSPVKQITFLEGGSSLEFVKKIVKHMDEHSRTKALVCTPGGVALHFRRTLPLKYFDAASRAEEVGEGGRGREEDWSWAELMGREENVEIRTTFSSLDTMIGAAKQKFSPFKTKKIRTFPSFQEKTSSSIFVNFEEGEAGNGLISFQAQLRLLYIFRWGSRIGGWAPEKQAMEEVLSLLDREKYEGKGLPPVVWVFNSPRKLKGKTVESNYLLVKKILGERGFVPSKVALPGRFVTPIWRGFREDFDRAFVMFTRTF